MADPESNIEIKKIAPLSDHVLTFSRDFDPFGVFVRINDLVIVAEGSCSDEGVFFPQASQVLEAAAGHPVIGPLVTEQLDNPDYLLEEPMLPKYNAANTDRPIPHDAGKFTLDGINPNWVSGLIAEDPLFSITMSDRYLIGLGQRFNDLGKVILDNREHTAQIFRDTLGDDFGIYT